MRSTNCCCRDRVLVFVTFLDTAKCSYWGCEWSKIYRCHEAHFSWSWS